VNALSLRVEEANARPLASSQLLGPLASEKFPKFDVVPATSKSVQV
jgi:hypothetical protein